MIGDTIAKKPLRPIFSQIERHEPAKEPAKRQDIMQIIDCNAIENMVQQTSRGETSVDEEETSEVGHKSLSPRGSAAIQI